MEELSENLTNNDVEKLRALLSLINKTSQKEQVTIRTFIDEYLHYVKNSLSPAYYRSNIDAFKHFTNYFKIQKPIASVTQKEVEEFIIYLKEKAPRGYVVYYRNLKAAFNKAKDWNYILENYFTKVKLAKKQRLAPGFINSIQLSAVSGYIQNNSIRDLVVTAFYTGLRLSELTNLRWGNVDNENNRIIIGDDNFVTKGRSQRFVPISEEAFEILVRRKTQEVRGAPDHLSQDHGRSEDGGQEQDEKKRISIIKFIKDDSTPPGITDEFVFCKSNGMRLTGDHVSKTFKRACKAAGLDNSIHFHSLRHSFASNLAQKGVSLYTIKELLGHSSISTTEIYSHLNMDSLREAVKKLDVKGERQEVYPPPSSERQISCMRENSQAKIFRISDVGI